MKLCNAVITLVVAVAVTILHSTAAENCTCGLARNQQLLQQFNVATGGATWYILWTGSDICSWTGVTCSGAEVIGLSVANNNLRGDFPGEILQNLTSLRTLYLGGNQLTGSRTLASMLPHLQKFNVYDNNMTGTLPSEFGAARAPAMTIFIVGLNQFSGTLPESYSSWTLLTQFDVYSNHLNGTLPEGFW
ncbi:GP46-like surface antigen, putative [Bodo saltans]|uniref:GP46-like surface antigen, putative n=1 Tax=Bodo saltans TaxID=75058 RepID=A0A0S4JVZ3_BODSA|nr:GP46-like surface antigen, putative [Bodo saltans]|eukprot:CUG93302.1 GP46-like surface antigen, putative [Bodo saltans]